MGKYKRISAEERWLIIKPIIEKQVSTSTVSAKSGIAESMVREWFRKYTESGMSGLENGKGWKQYSSELKKQAVEDALVNGLSKHEVVRKYEISSRSVLNDWIKIHNSGGELEATSSGRVGAIMNKGRKTSLEERIEIAQYAIARNLDYKTTMKKYDVSYQQVYSWVNKYKDNGPEALKDNRGRSKSPEELTENEKLRLRIKTLEARNEYLEMEGAIEKKLEELRHRYANIH
jgi:transposase-like protein